MEEHILFEQYTDMDKNIDTLARVKAKCMYYRQYKLCNKRCSSCSRNLRFKACYNELALCDQLKLDDTADYLFSIYNRNRLEYNYEKRQNKKINIFLISLLILISIAFIGVLLC